MLQLNHACCKGLPAKRVLEILRTVVKIAFTLPNTNGQAILRVLQVCYMCSMLLLFSCCGCFVVAFVMLSCVNENVSVESEMKLPTFNIFGFVCLLGL